MTSAQPKSAQLSDAKLCLGFFTDWIVFFFLFFTTTIIKNYALTKEGQRENVESNHIAIEQIRC